MQVFLRTHAHKILVGHGAAIALLTTSMMVATPKVILYVSPVPVTMHVGESATLSINLNAKVPINAVGMTLVIPPEVEVVSMSKEGSLLDLWTEETMLNESTGELRFSGGSLERDGITGRHTALTLTVKARQSGEALFSFKDTEVRAHDGTGDLVPTELRTLSITIAEKETPGAISEDSPATKALSADFDEKNGVTLADMSILMRRIVGSYDARFDLNHDGLLSLADLSVFFSLMQKR